MAAEQSQKISQALERMKKEFGDFIEQSWGTGEKAVNTLFSKMPRMGCELPVDIVETPDSVIVFVDVPGVPIENIQLTLVGNMLTLKGHFIGLVTSPGDNILRQSRMSGDFSQSLPLPVSVNPEHVSATAKDGVLKVVLTKAHSDRAHQIPIYNS
jgi:HSP20 family protein